MRVVADTISTELLSVAIENLTPSSRLAIRGDGVAQHVGTGPVAGDD